MMMASIYPAPMGMALALWICAALIPLLLAVGLRMGRITRGTFSLILSCMIVGVLGAALWDFHCIWESKNALGMPAHPGMGYADLPGVWTNNLMEAVQIGGVSAAFSTLLFVFLPRNEHVHESV